MKYFIIAGEASGDLHASNLVKGLKEFDKNPVFTGWGGVHMQEQGVVLLKHISELSFMGITEVLKNIRTIKKNFKICYSQIEEFKPDAVILVDFPGFNLRVARQIFSRVPRVYYYISPTVWAWHRSRMYTVRDYTSKMFVILPFEKEFYARFGIEVFFEGHPLLDAIPEMTPADMDRNRIAILPGSRKQEISAMLPVMLTTAAKLGSGYQFRLAAAPNISDDFYRQIAGTFPVELSREGTRSVLHGSAAAMVTSGTATLETALYGIPQVVCYTTSPLSYWIARALVDVKYISLVNLILREPLLKELIQGDLNSDALYNELVAILPGGSRREEILDGYQRLNGMIGKPGASRRVAEKICLDLCER